MLFRVWREISDTIREAEKRDPGNKVVVFARDNKLLTSLVEFFIKDYTFITVKWPRIPQ